MDGDAHVDGTLTLRQWRKRFPDGRMPVDQALAVIRQLAAALHEVHIKRPFHRDVVPSTVEVREHSDGSVSYMVPDLGAEAENHGEPGARRYLAPEQWWGGRQNTFTDQYALAVLFVELATGAVPFEAAFETEDETVMKTAVCNHPVKLPEDCPRRDALLRALSKDPRSRFPSCSAFVAALESTDERHAHGTHHGHHHHSHAHSHASARISARPRRRLSFGKILFVLVLFAAGGYWAVRAGLVERINEMLTAQERKASSAEKRQKAEQEAAVSAGIREERLKQIEGEIARQKEISERALKDLQVFLETGGPAALSIRKDAVEQSQRRVRQELSTVEGELESVRKLERGLAELRTGAGMFESVSGLLPGDSGLRMVYTNLVAEGQKLQSLIRQFTEKHPDVQGQREVFVDARRRYVAALDAALRQAKSSGQAKSARLAVLKDEVLRGDTELATISRDLQVAQLKQDELERTRARESQLLADLRLREHELRFGSGVLATNRIPGAVHP